jgi:UDPglucose 6-dehydrogenase
MSDSIQIAVVGSGYVGLVAAMCFAEMGHSVICVDNDASKIAALQAGESLIFEEHLPGMLQRYRNTRVRFTTDLAEATRACQVIFIAVGTPQTETRDADLSYVEAVASVIARSIHEYKVIVEKSTVPVYTNEWIRRVIERNGVPREKFDVVSNPEFLREGTAIVDFLHPDRIIIGTDSERAAKLLSAIYAPLTDGDYYKKEDAIVGDCSSTQPPILLLTSTKSAEIIKHASNAFLALKISYINMVSNLCEAADANIEEVARGMGLDSRIGSKFLRPGIGYGGSCFPKDVAAFHTVAEQMGVDFNLLSEVEKVNVAQKERFLSKVRSTLWTMRGKKLAVLGLSFKGGTDDIRESPAISIVKILLCEGCSVVAYDPAAMKNAAAVLPPSEQMHYAASVYEASKDADAVLILTDWTEFKTIDLDRLQKLLRYPIVIDGRNLYDPKIMVQSGFTYLSMGRPTTTPSHRHEPVAIYKEDI